MYYLATIERDSYVWIDNERNPRQSTMLFKNVHPTLWAKYENEIWRTDHGTKMVSSCHVVDSEPITEEMFNDMLNEFSSIIKGENWETPTDDDTD